MTRRVIVSLLSTIVFSFIISFMMYTPVSERQPATWYDPFGSALPILFIITGLAYLLGGIPSSLLIDKYVKKEMVKLLLYVIVGFVVGVITILVIALFSGGKGPIPFPFLGGFGIFGSAGSFLFFIFMVLSKKLKKTPSTNKGFS